MFVRSKPRIGVPCKRPVTCAKRFGSISRTGSPKSLVSATKSFAAIQSTFFLLSLTETASFEDKITEGEVQLALKKVGSGKSPGFAALSYALYLRLSYMFVPILTVVINNCFQQESIPDLIFRGIITLLKKDKHITKYS